MTIEEAIERLEFLKGVYSVDTETALGMAIGALSADAKPRGTYQCFHCGSYSVVWGADFDFSDYGYEGEGIVHSCHCANCGADIEYRIRLDDEDD